MNKWRTTMQRNVRRLTPEQARAKLDAIRAEGITINHPTVRALTGGYSSQTIITVTVQALAMQAGLRVRSKLF